MNGLHIAKSNQSTFILIEVRAEADRPCAKCWHTCEVGTQAQVVTMATTVWQCCTNSQLGAALSYLSIRQQSLSPSAIVWQPISLWGQWPIFRGFWCRQQISGPTSRLPFTVHCLYIVTGVSVRSNHFSLSCCCSLGSSSGHCGVCARQHSDKKKTLLLCWLSTLTKVHPAARPRCLSLTVGRISPWLRTVFFTFPTRSNYILAKASQYEPIPSSTYLLPQLLTCPSKITLFTLTNWTRSKSCFQFHRHLQVE